MGAAPAAAALSQVVCITSEDRINQREGRHRSETGFRLSAVGEGGEGAQKRKPEATLLGVLGCGGVGRSCRGGDRRPGASDDSLVNCKRTNTAVPSSTTAAW